MRVILRAFTKDGYYKDIACMTDRQVTLIHTKLIDNTDLSSATGLIGHGVSLDPTAFPEVIRFEIVIPLIDK
jgi:hypothetical protein